MLKLKDGQREFHVSVAKILASALARQTSFPAVQCSTDLEDTAGIMSSCPGLPQWNTRDHLGSHQIYWTASENGSYSYWGINIDRTLSVHIQLISLFQMVYVCFLLLLTIFYELDESAVFSCIEECVLTGS